MEDLIDDLRAALDQMNRHLAQISKNTERTQELLDEKQAKEKGLKNES